MKKKLFKCLSLVLTTSLLVACSEDVQKTKAPEILISQSGDLVTKESGEVATFSMTLSQDPGREVVIDIISSDLSEGSVEPSVVTLDGSNWYLPVSFTITGLSDGIVDGDIDYKVMLAEKIDGAMTDLLVGVELDVKNLDIDHKVIIDPELASFKLSSTKLSTREGESSVDFTLALGSKPTAEVAVTVAVSDGSEGSLSQSLLSFNTDNWQQAQIVKVNPLTDGIVDGDQDYVIEFGVSSTDKRYNGYTIGAIEVTNVDVDVPVATGIPIRVVAGNITSGDGQSYDEGHGIRIFQALKPDIVMIQEFNMESSSLGSMVTKAFGPEFKYVVGDGSIPNGVVSRFPIIESGAWASNASSNRDWDWAVIDLPGPKELLVVSVHLNTKDHNQELQPLKAHIQSKAAEGDYYVLLGGDFNTKSRGEVETVLSSLLDAKGPYPVDQNNKDGTNASRKSPYDWVLCSHAWAKFEVPVVIGRHSYPHGHVFDSRVYSRLGELKDVVPVQAGDSSSPNMQHMAIVRDFVFQK